MSFVVYVVNVYLINIGFSNSLSYGFYTEWSWWCVIFLFYFLEFFGLSSCLKYSHHHRPYALAIFALQHRDTPLASVDSTSADLFGCSISSAFIRLLFDHQPKVFSFSVSLLDDNLFSTSSCKLGGGYCISSISFAKLSFHHSTTLNFTH